MRVAVSDDNGYAAEAGAEIAARGGNAVECSEDGTPRDFADPRRGGGMAYVK